MRSGRGKRRSRISRPRLRGRVGSRSSTMRLGVGRRTMRSGTGRRSSTFGPTLMFGLGGIFVEVLKDVTFRVAPFSKKQARSMIGEISGAPILSGIRGEKPKDQEGLADTICRYANMIFDLREEILESDANPVLVYEEGNGLKVADARIVLKKD